MDYKGLSDNEVLKSREKYGDNSLTETKQETFFDKLKENLKDPMIKILIAALVLNTIFTMFGKAHWYETVGIAAAVLIAVFVSTFSEFRNENTFRKLKEQAGQIKAKVYRNGILKELLLDDIVKDDIIRLETGDKVPADGYVVFGEIKVDQSVLNGESEEISKTPSDKVVTPDFFDSFSVFRGTVVSSGNALFKVVTVGDKTEYGKIYTELSQKEDRLSPLKLKLTTLAKSISKFAYIGAALIAAAFMFQQIVFEGVHGAENILLSLIQAVILSVSIIVMAVPEGLPLMIAIVSALNMGKMLKANVLVRKLSGIETAGSLNILYSDKTGTITKGKLEVILFSTADGKTFSNIEDVPANISKILCGCIYGNSTATISNTEKGTEVIGGNATERATLNFVKNMPSPNLKILESIPFNSTDKFSASKVTGELDGFLVKGAPEKVIKACDSYYNENGEKLTFSSLTDSPCQTENFSEQSAKYPLVNKSVIENQIDDLAKKAIRVIALSIDNTLVGILGIRDELRPESISAISEVQRAGIQVVMITGDRKDTALAVAKEAGILNSSKSIVTDSIEISKMSDEELKKIIPDIRVIARALPADKSRLVRLSQELGLVAGMTGDGVNDSPALKKADVGFSMGSGTEVAKEASDIVIMNDNFISIGNAVLYGRTIFNNIRKFIIFQLTINVAAVATAFVGTFLGLSHSPLTIIQILWINLIMDSLAAIAFGGEPALSRFMSEKPKRRDEPILNKDMLSQIIISAVTIFSIGLLYFSNITDVVNRHFRPDDGDRSYLLTGFFAFFVISAMWGGFNSRTDRINVFENIKKNTSFLKIMGGIFVIQAVITHIGGAVFSSYGLTLKEWAVVVITSLLILPIGMIRKIIVKRR